MPKETKGDQGTPRLRSLGAGPPPPPPNGPAAVHFGFPLPTRTKRPLNQHTHMGMKHQLKTTSGYVPRFLP